MKRPWVCFFLLSATSLFCTSCGSGRHLQSISIGQTVNGQEVQFVATGTYSAAPTTVTPLAVDWTLSLLSPPPPTYTYTLTNQPYVFNCTGIHGPQAITALAPTDPTAPVNGSTKNVAMASQAFSCP